MHHIGAFTKEVSSQDRATAETVRQVFISDQLQQFLNQFFHPPGQDRKLISFELGFDIGSMELFEKAK